MKKFELPKSDCDVFVGGLLDGNVIEQMIADGAPQFGVVVWYRDKETMKAALQAVSDAHWPDPS